MAVLTNPLIQLKITGSNITSNELSETFVLDTKIEQTYSLQDVTPEIELDLSNVDNKKILILIGNQDFTLHCYQELEAPISGEIFTYSFDIPIKKGLGFILNTTLDFFNAINKFTISTGSVNLIKVTAACYGENIS